MMSSLLEKQSVFVKETTTRCPGHSAGLVRCIANEMVMGNNETRPGFDCRRSKQGESAFKIYYQTYHIKKVRVMWKGKYFC